ncbi:MAG: PIN domain-containing protein [Propionibacteriaceae bacterium]|nr:PIN domain-containing protein [Propionibacteriaceae bacterium]
MIIDTSVLLAFFHPKESSHKAVSDLLGQADEPLIVSPYVIAELDYLVLTRLGVNNELKVIRALLEPAWEIAKITDAQFSLAAELIERYADERIGLTDAINVILADTHHTNKIATLDRRHFSVLRLPNGSPVEIVP